MVFVIVALVLFFLLWEGCVGACVYCGSHGLGKIRVGVSACTEACHSLFATLGPESTSAVLSCMRPTDKG